MTPPRPTSAKRTNREPTRDEVLQAITDALDAEQAAAEARLAAVAAARAYTPEEGEDRITWAEITSALREPHTSHVISHYNDLLREEVTRTVTVVPGAVDRDAVRKRRRRAGAR